MFSKSTRRLAPGLFTLTLLGACSVRQLSFVPDSELEDDSHQTTGASAMVSTAGKTSTGGKTGSGGSDSGGSVTTMGGKTSTGGTTSTAGTTAGGTAPQGGVGGMPPLTQCPTPHSAQNQPLIDDFEDGNAGLPMPMMGGRAGGWYVVTDGTMGVVMPDQTKPPNPDRPGYDAAMNGMAGYALHLSGGGFKDWGATIGTDLLRLPELDKRCPYYIEGFQGIRFFIKGYVADGFVRFTLLTQETSDVENGGFCDPARVKCFDNFGKEVPVGMDWKQQSVRFTELKQAGGGMMDLNVTHALGIEFAAHGAKSTPTGTCPDNLCTFDFWVDQIEFF